MAMSKLISTRLPANTAHSMASKAQSVVSNVSRQQRQSSANKTSSAPECRKFSKGRGNPKPSGPRPDSVLHALDATTAATTADATTAAQHDWTGRKCCKCCKCGIEPFGSTARQVLQVRHRTIRQHSTHRTTRRLSAHRTAHRQARRRDAK